MRFTIDPGKKKPTLSFVEIPYTKQPDLEGNMMDLHITLIKALGNSEMRSASGIDDEMVHERSKLVCWFNGNGWHHVPHNMMAAEFVYMAEHGYAVAIVQYRGSEKAHWPAQIEDCKTGIRFLRAHAEEYKLDTTKVTVMGRSAGGQLAAMCAMNDGTFITDEYKDQSCEVQFAIDMFGPADMVRLNKDTEEAIKVPGYRWSRMEQTHTGMLMGGDMNTLNERLYDVSPINHINDKMCPMLIMHGDEDPLIPVDVSEDFYKRLCDAGLEDRVDLCIVHKGGHGTREFWQYSTRELILKYLDKYMA